MKDIYQVFWVSSDCPTSVQWAVFELSTDKKSEEKQAFLANTDKKALYTKSFSVNTHTHTPHTHHTHTHTRGAKNVYM